MDLINGFKEILGIGLEPKDLTILQVCLRGVLVFFVAIVMVRMGDKRFLARMTAFDAILGFILASMLARAINGSAPLLPSSSIQGSFTPFGQNPIVHYSPFAILFEEEEKCS